MSSLQLIWTFYVEPFINKCKLYCPCKRRRKRKTMVFNDIANDVFKKES